METSSKLKWSRRSLVRLNIASDLARAKKRRRARGEGPGVRVPGPLPLAAGLIHFLHDARSASTWCREAISNVCATRRSPERIPHARPFAKAQRVLGPSQYFL